MPSNRCPKCQRKTYSAKFNSCTSEGCSLNHSVDRVPMLPSQVGALRTLHTFDHPVVADTYVDVTKKPVTKNTAVNVTAKRGRPAKANALSPAERQRAHRAKAKAS